MHVEVREQNAGISYLFPSCEYQESNLRLSGLAGNTCSESTCPTTYFKDFIFNCVCVWKREDCIPHRGHKMSDSLALELQVVLSYLMWMLRFELGSSAKLVLLSPEPSLQPQTLFFETGPLTGSVGWTKVGWLANFPGISGSLPPQHWDSHLAFYVYGGDRSICPHAFMRNTLANEPSPNFQLFKDCFNELSYCGYT